MPTLTPISRCCGEQLASGASAPPTTTRLVCRSSRRSCQSAHFTKGFIRHGNLRSHRRGGVPQPPRLPRGLCFFLRRAASLGIQNHLVRDQDRPSSHSAVQMGATPAGGYTSHLRIVHREVAGKARLILLIGAGCVAMQASPARAAPAHPRSKRTFATCRLYPICPLCPFCSYALRNGTNRT